MGMYTGQFKVVDQKDASNNLADKVLAANNSQNTNIGQCVMSGGGCGCGAKQAAK